MANSYVSLLVHVVFSTTNREPWLSPNVRERLFPYLGGIAKKERMVALSIGGTSDHVHLLISLPSTLSIAQAVQSLKGGSSLWVHQSFAHLAGFSWQEGYGAFSIGISQLEETGGYIEGQEEHHHKTTFQEEYVAFLRKNNVQFDERYVFG